MAPPLVARRRVPLIATKVLDGASRRSEYLILIALLGVSLVDLSWGLPESWPSDEVSWIVSRMLTEHTANTNWFYYPNLMMNASYLAARFVGLPILSGLGWDQTYAVGYTTRLVSVGFYLLTVLLIARAVCLLFGLKRAPFAVFFIGTIGALNHHAHLGTVSSSLLFGIALSIYFFVRTCKTRSETAFYCSVAAASLAIGAKYNGVFLFLSLPILWRWAFPAFSAKALVRSLFISGILAPAVFLLTTPYAALDAQEFMLDVNDWINVEGPAFGSMSLLVFADHLKRSYIGFFTVGVLAIMLAVLFPTLRAFARAAVRSKPAATLSADRQAMHMSMLVLGVAFLAYQVVSFRVGNYQPRHYLPGALILASMFLIAWYYWRSTLSAERHWPRIGLVVLACVIVALASANTFAHVWVFSVSAKNQTLSILQDATNRDPQGRIGAIAMPRRSPFQRGVVDDHVDFFYVDEARYDIDSWDEYLGIIGDHYRQLNPRYIVIEDSVFMWPVFLPKRFASDYGKRLDYPNPGPIAWNAMLERIGYRQARIVKTGRLPRVVEWLMGSENQFTSEGVGEKVYLYEKAPVSTAP